MKARLYVFIFAVFSGMLLSLFFYIEDSEAKIILASKIMNNKSVQIINNLNTFYTSKEIKLLKQIIKEIENLSKFQEPNNKEWPEIRKEVAELWFRTLQTVKKEIDKNFDFDNTPQINVAPTGPYPAGIAPKSIKEPEIRKKYEKAIAINKTRAKKYNFQLNLRKIEKSLSKKVENFIVKAYSKGSQSNDELIKYFEKYKIEQKMRYRLLQRIINK